MKLRVIYNAIVVLIIMHWLDIRYYNRPVPTNVYYATKRKCEKSIKEMNIIIKNMKKYKHLKGEC